MSIDFEPDRQRYQRVCSSQSAEGEDVRAHARPVECDLEGPPADRAWLADELVHPGLGERAFAGLVDVEAMGIAGWLSFEEDRDVERGA